MQFPYYIVRFKLRKKEDDVDIQKSFHTT